jgi:2-haloacid dehalogenase
MEKPRAVAFDVIETLFALDRLAGRFRAVGLPDGALPLFFAQMLRDAFALEATAIYKPFREIAAANLSIAMAGHGIAPTQSAVEDVLGGFKELDPHPDVRPAIERLARSGIRLFALSNGAAAGTSALLSRAGLSSLFEKVISIDEVRRWKPNREVYLHAARAAGVPPEGLWLIAGHAWDLHGAKQAGLRTAWVRRKDNSFHASMSAPDLKGASLTEIADSLLAL